MRSFTRIAVAFACWLMPFSAPSAEPATVMAAPIERFAGAGPGERVGKVVFRGGLVLESTHPDFGGLSGLAFLDAARWVMVTDRGRFVTGRLDHDGQGAPTGLSSVMVERMRDSTGNLLASPTQYDAEAVEIIIRDGTPAAVRVGFEKNTRVADYDLVEGRPTGTARPVPLPGWLSALRTNESIESVCIAPPASPIAGSTLIITEGHSVEPGTWASTLLGVADRGDLALVRSGSFRPTDCAFLPDGDLLVLERGIAVTGFTMQIRRIRADRVRAGAQMDGAVIVSGTGRNVDNMEGLGIRRTPEGEIRLVLVSDDNFFRFQRTLLLEFALP